MHVSDEDGFVEVSYKEGAIVWGGGCGFSGEMTEFLKMNYEEARKLYNGLGRLLHMRDTIIDKGLEITARNK